MKTNDLFFVSEPSPAMLAKTRQVSFQYVLTLFLCKEEPDRLALTSPCFPLSFPIETKRIQSIIQIIFSDFLIDLFHTAPFAFIGIFLQQSFGSRLFSLEKLPHVKDSIVRLRMSNNFESMLQFLDAIKELATTDAAVESEEKWFAATASSQTASKLIKVKSYVMENFRNQIKREEVAAIAGLSSNGFSRFFMRQTGLHFNDFVNAIRVETASKLLRRTDDTISGIAYSCGFNTDCYFINVFKQFKKMTPGEFRTSAASKTCHGGLDPPSPQN